MMLQDFSSVTFTNPDTALFVLVAGTICTVIGLVGPFVLFRDMVQEEREEVRRRAVESMKRIAATLVLAVALSTVLYAGVVIEDPCSETYLRRVCGDLWEVCWRAGGCFLPY